MNKLFYTIVGIVLGFLIYKVVCKYGVSGNKCKLPKLYKEGEEPDWWKEDSQCTKS